jgi:hypothetical protein
MAELTLAKGFRKPRRARVCATAGAAIRAAAPKFSAKYDKPVEVSAPADDPLQQPFDEIDALNRKRTYAQVPNDPA